MFIHIVQKLLITHNKLLEIELRRGDSYLFYTTLKVKKNHQLEKNLSTLILSIISLTLSN